MKSARIIFSLGLVAAVTACSNVRPTMRDDLNNPAYSAQEPTTGGMFPEGRWFDRAAGGRNPASGSNGGNSGGRREDWVSADQKGTALRDKTRGNQSGENSAESNDGEQAAAETPFKSGNRAKREDFLDEGMTDGSLWASTGQTNYFFIKNRIRSPGDIVTVKIDDNLIKNAAAELKRALTKPEVEAELEVARKKKTEEMAKAGGRATASAGGPTDKNKDDPNQKKPDVDVSFADIDPQAAMVLATGELMMGEIVERYSNGNYKIRGSKRVPYRGTVRILNMVGIARIQDLSEDDTIEAGKLYEYKVKFSQNF